MQKARRHPDKSRLRPLVSVWFQVLFTPLIGVLFTFPLRYQFTIGLSVVFSLTGWCRQIQTEFHLLRPTQDTRLYINLPSTGLSPSSVALSIAFLLDLYIFRRSYNPILYLIWFRLFRFRSPLLTESLLFSLPPVTQMFQFTGFPSWLTPERYVFNITGCPIRTSADQCSFATPRSFSQLTTSFVVSESQGIPHTPFFASIPLFITS